MILYSPYQNERKIAIEHAKEKGNIAYIINTQLFGGKFATMIAHDIGSEFIKPVGSTILQTTDKKYHISLVTDNQEISLAKIARTAAEYASGKGGGTNSVAGAIIPNGNIDMFLDEMDKMINTLLS